MCRGMDNADQKEFENLKSWRMGENLPKQYEISLANNKLLNHLFVGFREMTQELGVERRAT